MQTSGRAARNIGGKVIFYADHMTDSMKRTIDETNRRREKQLNYNKEHHITAETIYKTAEEILATTRVADVRQKIPKVAEKIIDYGALDKEDLVERLTKEMQSAAANLEFEKAAIIRDEIKQIKGKRSH